MAQIVVTTSEELKRKAKAKAALEGQSLSWIIRTWLVLWLAETSRGQGKEQEHETADSPGRENQAGQ